MNKINKISYYLNVKQFKADANNILNNKNLLCQIYYTNIIN